MNSLSPSHTAVNIIYSSSTQMPLNQVSLRFRDVEKLKVDRLWNFLLVCEAQNSQQIHEEFK